MTETVHESVLLEETLEMLSLEEKGGELVVVDGTLGGAGHTIEILRRAKKAFVVGFDQDSVALERAERRLSEFQGRYHLVHANFSELTARLESLSGQMRQSFGSSDLEGNAPVVDRILLDLGISSDQLNAGDRGFSFRENGPLDMRMNRESGETAAELLNDRSQRDLERIFLRGGVSAPLHRLLAAEIIRSRPLVTTADFAVVCRRVARGRKGESGKDPATVPFQAIRIEVNQETKAIESVLPQAFSLLAPGGRLLVISFHSLEDKVVARVMRAWGREGELPPGVPIRGEAVRTGKLLTPSAIVPGEAELKSNPRARSARMRVFRKAGGSEVI